MALIIILASILLRISQIQARLYFNTILFKLNFDKIKDI